MSPSGGTRVGGGGAGFLKTVVLKKLVVLLTIVNGYPSLTIVNDNPSLTIVNEERRREETGLKGIGTYH